MARSTTIPEELGRISYLLSDKTGTLTQNQMVFKKLHLGTAAYCNDTFDDISRHLSSYYSSQKFEKKPGTLRKNVITRISEAVKALALCHNVTPVYENVHESAAASLGSIDELATEADQAAMASGSHLGTVTYQASSPDEVALGQFV